jgi:hypothetical protein
MSRRPVEGKRTAPVVPHQHDIVQAQRLDPGIEKFGMIGEPVGNIGFARTAHPDQIRCETSARTANGREDMPPEIR